MVGLLVVELLEEFGGEGGVFSNEGERFIGGHGGVDGQVGVTRHASPVEDAEGVLTEGGVGLAMFDRGRTLLGFVVL